MENKQFLYKVDCDCEEFGTPKQLMKLIEEVPHITQHHLSTLLLIHILHLCKIFLDCCFKRKDTSKPVNVYDFLERQDRKIFRILIHSTGHPLLPIITRVKPSSCQFRKETCYKAKIITVCFRNSFTDSLVFKYDLAF